MVTEAINTKKQLANMKATLDRISKASAEKDTQIKRQNEQIAELMKKLWSEASNKGLRDKDSDKESSHDEDSDDRRVPKRDFVLGSMFTEQI